MTVTRTIDGRRLLIPPRLRCAALALTWLLVAPVVALAQSTIAGEVRDLSGGVLPGVTVDASSDALIEKVRTAVTDESGKYRIVDLRPGLYTMTFTLTGFATLRREHVELPAEFTATVNTELGVGGMRETVVVTGDVPLVDVQNAVQTTRFDRDLLDTIPAGQNIWEMAELVPSINLYNASAQHAGTVGGQGGATQTYMSVRGMGAEIGRASCRERV